MIYSWVYVNLLSLLLCFEVLDSYCWLPKEVAEWAVSEFHTREQNRRQITWRGVDRRSSSPFITGDGFRDYCKHICDDGNRCRMTPETVKDGECIFVKSDFYEFFATDVFNRLSSKFIVISHNGDLSSPDGQSDARVGMKKYITSNIVEEQYKAGKLIAHHGQNLWWSNISSNATRPEYLHCLPIGFENRQYPVGRNVELYTHALTRNVINRFNYTLEEESKRPLLLVAFYPKSRIPDRFKVLQMLGAIPPKGQPKPINTWYNETDLSHDEWLDSINYHRFVLAPFGHGLDTHRISEILLMGGIPVMRRSGISSCYDDTDNDMNGKSRGSLPVVILDSWKELTADRLELEWKRITQFPKTHWDWRRLFIDHWLERIS